MLLELQLTIPLSWIQEHLSIYADDCHVGGTFTNVQEFEFLLQAIGTLFSLLHEFDMKLNPNKSVALLAMHGPKSRKTRASHVQRDTRGEMLKIPVPGQPPVLIPIKETAPYLGCIMSYHNLEDTTTWHRVKLAHIGFLRLRRWLCNKHHFSLQHRLGLWRTCIVPILTYGVFAVGITDKGIKHMLTQLSTMLRRIVGDHAHRTGNTNVQVFETFNLPRPADILTTAVATLQRSLAQRELMLDTTDVALQLDWKHLEPMHASIMQAQAAHSLHRVETALSGEAPDFSPCHFCNMCDFCTNSVAAFRRHCTTSHGLSMFRIFAHPLHSYTTDGLPKCKHCGHCFSTWRSFRVHIERGCQAILLGPDRCTGIPAALTMPTLSQQRVDVSMRGTTMLTAESLALLKSKPWGNRVLQIIADDQLDQLETEHEACGYLSKFCCLCGQHLNRTQDVHLHFRTEHAAYWTCVPQKSKVLTNLHSSETPCPHCGGCFKTHQCPVWTQISVLLLHGGGLHATESSQPAAVARCDICLMPFPDVTQLMTHLQAEHRLTGFTFNAARDSLNAEAICAHCGAAFSSMESLRSHITQGRCSCFDSQAATEVAPISQAWLDICLHGKMYEHLRAPMDRLHMTIRCTQCKQAYQRAGDLANHLMSNHSRLWRQAQHLTLMLVDLVFSRYGCMCNPQINQLRQNHICLPLRQISMMYYRLDSIPFMPVQLTDQVLNQMLHSSISKEMRFHVCRIFADRDFKELWSDPEVTKFLSRTCTQCGQDLSAGLLCRHIHEAHMCGHRFVEFYFDTLVPAIAKTLQFDHKCDLCSQIFNLPPDQEPTEPTAPRAVLVQEHLRGNCPVILQSSVLLATALNGGRLGYDWLGSELSSPNQGDFPVPAPAPGHQPEIAPKPESCEATQNRRKDPARTDRSRSGRGRAPEPAAIPPSPRPVSLTTRAQLELAAKHRLFHTVFPAGQRGIDSCPPPGDTEMATAAPAGAGCPNDTAQTTPVPILSPGLADQNNQSVPEQAGRAPVQAVPGKELDPGRHELAVPPLGPDQEAASDRQEEISFHAQDAGALDGAGGGLPRSSLGPEIPGALHQHPTGDSAMEAAAEPEVQQAIRPDDDADPLSGVALGRDDIETSLDPTEQPCQDGPEPSAEGSRERKGSWQVQGEKQSPRYLAQEDHHGLFYKMALLVLGNDSNWCFANSMTYCLLWTLLCQQCPDISQWGPHFESLHHFISTSSDQTILLTGVAWFETSNCVRSHDTGHHDMPLFLQFTPELALHDTCTFQQLINTWHQADGMRAALLQAAPVLCVHVDRLISAPTSRIEKSSCAFNLESDTRFPIFSDACLQCANVQYILVAGAAHLGIDAAGHYQAFLRMRPAILEPARPVQWLITQDNVQAYPSWEVPDLLSRNLTVAWFVRSDCIYLPLLQLAPHIATADTERPDAMTQLLQLLSKEDKTT